MVHTKKLELLLFLSFLVFPFGQLFKIGSISVLDILVALFVVISFIQKRISVDKHLFATLCVFSFSLIFGGIFLKINVIVGFLYLIRLTTYFLFAVCLKQYVSVDHCLKDKLLSYLFVGLISIGLFGWIQYFVYPDFRPFFAFGWDDHLFRLIGTFLDPGFTSIFLVFGFLLSLIYFKTSKNKLYIFSAVFFLVTLLFTYSRAGYIALAISNIYILTKNKTYSYIVYSFIFLFFVFSLLGLFSSYKVSEGTNLLRTYSIGQRVLNTKVGGKIFISSPLFGVGYNNICEYKAKYFNYSSVLNHSCSGLDNSIVFVLATTGFFGLLSLIKLFSVIHANTSKDLYGEFFTASGVALLVHSQFNNSLFYPFCLFVMAIVYSISRKSKA